MTVYDRLRDVRHSDNICTVRWTNIHARGWDIDTCALALYFCPRGRFTPTTYVDGDERRRWTEGEKREKERFGAPVYVLAKGAYFDFPVDVLEDTGALHLMQRCGLINELMLTVAKEV